MELVSVEICAQSGLLAGPRCTHRVEERFVAGTAPSRVCDQHAADGTWLLPPRYARWVERNHPPGVEVASARVPAEAPLVVRYPRDGARLLIDLERGATEIPLRATLGHETVTDLEWFVDGERVDGGRWRATPGRHRIEALLGARRSPPVEIEVVAPSQ